LRRTRIAFLVDVIALLKVASSLVREIVGEIKLNPRVHT
jgi:hypothetical protein